MRMLRLVSIPLTALLVFAACAGGQKNNSTTTTTTTTTQSSPAASPSAAAPAGSPAASPSAASAMKGAHGHHGHMALNASPAPIPASLTCGGQAPVWTNSRSKAYHVSSDPMYGRTKHGAYMCLRNAVNAGYHAAMHGGGAMHGAANGAATPAASPT